VVQLKPAKVTEDGGDGQPEDQTFEAEIVNSKEKEPQKSEGLGNGEGAHAAATVKEPGEMTTAAVQSKTRESSLWLAICRSYCKPFVIGSFFKLGHDILLFLSPMLLK